MGCTRGASLTIHRGCLGFQVISWIVAAMPDLSSACPAAPCGAGPGSHLYISPPNKHSTSLHLPNWFVVPAVCQQCEIPANAWTGVALWYAVASVVAVRQPFHRQRTLISPRNTMLIPRSWGTICRRHLRSSGYRALDVYLGPMKQADLAP